MDRKDLADIASGRLSAEQLAQNFDDVAPPLDRQNALIAAQRCYYCYDAPCIQACPTGIDIPSFIRRITTDNLRGAAQDILGANVLGGMCARVCPTEILCEGSCVRNTGESLPVQIGALQRYATDWVFDSNTALFERAAATGKRVAVVGAGPAGLSCAHALARAGHDVVIFDAKPRPGGLNEYGIAEYKVLDFAAREIDWLLSLGGIRWEGGRTLGDDLPLSELRRDYDAVFLGLGLTGVNALGIEGEALAGVRNAVDFIADLRQCPDLSKLPVGRRVVVIGGGNTAIDAAVQSKKLGAESVTLVYRRGSASMSATWAEQEFAKTQGVSVIEWAQPRRLLGDGAVSAIEFEYTQLDDNGRLLGSGDYFTLAADSVLKAIGQTLIAPRANGDGSAVIEIRNGRIAVNAEFETSVRGVWAGGDCVGGKVDLTVQSVEDGKRAARAMHARLVGGNGTTEN